MAAVKNLYQLLAVASLLCLAGCASTEELFAEYDAEFCPAPELHEMSHAPLKKEKVIIREVPAASRYMAWDPAVYFDTASADLSGVAEETLRSNLAFLEKFPRFNVSIRGFTDQYSNNDFNRTLSADRVKRVRQFFKESGIHEGRLGGRAHGESIAVDAVTSTVLDDINRRVEMILIDSSGRLVIRKQPLVLGPAE